MENICRFAPSESAPDVIRIWHFVYETGQKNQLIQLIENGYRVGIVSAGEATLTCRGRQERLKRGDLFFILPATHYTLQGDGDFCYYYIRFMGIRAGMLLEQMGIRPTRGVFCGFASLLPFWKQALEIAGNRPDLSGESVLLYSLLCVEHQYPYAEAPPKVGDVAKNMLLAQKYIDDHIGDADLNLEGVARAAGYQAKYLSAAFKRYFKVGVREYIVQARINKACVLMEQNYTCIKDIAAMCGFQDAMYFSKVFRQKMGLSPREQVAQLQKKA